MNIQVFCYAGLLRFPEQLQASVALLPEAQKAEATSFVASVRDLPRSELLQRWSELREQEYLAIGLYAEQRWGIRLDELPPTMRELCMSWLIDQHG